MDKTWRMSKVEFENKAIEYLDNVIKNSKERIETSEGENKKEVYNAFSVYVSATKNNKPDYITKAAHLYNTIGGKFYYTEPMNIDEIILLEIISVLTNTHLICFSFIMEYNRFTEDQLKDIIFIQSGLFSFDCWNDECVDFVADLLSKSDDIVDSEVKVVLNNPASNEHFKKLLNEKISHKSFTSETTIEQRKREIIIKNERLVILNKELDELRKLYPFVKDEIYKNIDKIADITNPYELGNIIMDIFKIAASEAFNIDQDELIDKLVCYYPITQIIADIKKHILTDTPKRSKRTITKEGLKKLYLGFPSKIEYRTNVVYSEISKTNRYINVAKTIIDNKKENSKSLTIINRLDWFFLDSRHDVSYDFINKYSKFIKHYHEQDEIAAY